MDYKGKIDELTDKLRVIDSQLNALELGAEKGNKEQRIKLIEQRLHAQSSLSALYRLQWDEEHERVNFDEDR